MDEMRLPGGNVGGAIKVGATVRRPAGRWTPTIQRLLQTLVDAGISEVPRPLGLDERGREAVSYIPGETVVEDWWPDWSRSEATVRDIGRLMRRLHDASEGLGEGEVLPWRLTDAAVDAGQVVCHNDIAPYNIVWRRQTGVVGLIDWDFASPGDRRVDLAFALWQFAPLHHPQLTARLGWPNDVDRLSHARALVDAYGLDPELRLALPEFILERMMDLRRTIRRLADEGQTAFQFHIDRGDLDDITKSAEFVQQLRPSLEEALTN